MNRSIAVEGKRSKQRSVFTPRVEAADRKEDLRASSVNKTSKIVQLDNLQKEVRKEAQMKQKLRGELSKLRNSIETLSKFKVKLKSKF